MPSTETRRYADLITLIRETVNDATEDGSWKDTLKKIWELASDEEKTALVEFATWFEHLDE